MWGNLLQGTHALSFQLLITFWWENQRGKPDLYGFLCSSLLLPRKPPPDPHASALKVHKEKLKQNHINEQTNINKSNIHRKCLPCWHMKESSSHVLLFQRNKACSHHKWWLMTGRAGMKWVCACLCAAAVECWWIGHYGVKSTSTYLLNKPTTSTQPAPITLGSRISPFNIV